MRTIAVSPALWNNELVVNRLSFDEIIVKAVSTYIKSMDELDKFYLVFPSSVTKFQRYSIHKLSIYNEFKTESYDNANGERMIKVALSKNYLYNLFEGYIFDNDVTIIEEPVPKTDKQVLFDTLLNYIQTNLPEQFEIYLASI